MLIKLLQLINSRLIFGLGFLATVGATAMSILYFQLYLGLIPCNLCELQRIIVIILMLIFLIAVIHNPKTLGVRIYSVILLLFSIFGLLIAGYQTWLQTLPPDQAPNCSPSLNYLLTALPIKNAIIAIFKGSSECFRVQWRFLNLSIAGWSTVFFAGLSIVNIWQIFRKLPKYYRHFNEK